MKESHQKSKKTTKAKETKQKGSAKTTSSSTRNTLESRKPKDAVLPNTSSSADQTAAGLLPCRNVQHVNSSHWSLYTLSTYSILVEFINTSSNFLLAITNLEIVMLNYI